MAVVQVVALARARTTTTTTTRRRTNGDGRRLKTMRTKMIARERASLTMMRANEEEREAPKVEIVEDEVEEAVTDEAEEGTLRALLKQLEMVISDNDEAAQLLSTLKTEIGNVDAKVVGMEDQVGAVKDQYLRLNADFDNFRKRTIKEKEVLASTAKGKVVEAMLPVLDNFDLAAKNIKGETEGEKKILTGYQNMHKQLVDVLFSQGLQLVPGVGSPFDPNEHEAIMRTEDDSVEQDTILEEFRKGYKIGGNLIRPSMVKVSAKP